MPPAPLTPFELWACGRLRGLYDARVEDARRGNTRKASKFGTLLKHNMEEYEQQPFSRANYPKNLHPDGRPIHTEQALRKKADQYLRNHSVQPLVKLAQFEAQGGEAADHPGRAAPAMEIWASTEKDRIRTLVHQELRLPLDTPAYNRPDTYLGVRKQIVKREFELLPEDEQVEWRDMARERKAKVDKGRPLPIVIQDRQENFSGDLASSLEKQFGNGAFGKTFIFSFQGLFIGAEDNVVHRFRGQVSSFDAPQWHETAGYLNEVLPIWYKFARTQTQGYVAPRLPKLTGDPSATELKELRDLLKRYFVLMFDFAVDGPDPVDATAFWADVAERAFDYVDGARLPEGTRFGDPALLPVGQFVSLYRHVWASQAKRGEVDEDERFLYRQSIVEETRATQRALRLKRKHATRRARASEAAMTDPPPAYEANPADDMEGEPVTPAAAPSAPVAVTAGPAPPATAAPAPALAPALAPAPAPAPAFTPTPTPTAAPTAAHAHTLAAHAAAAAAAAAPMPATSPVSAPTPTSVPAPGITTAPPPPAAAGPAGDRPRVSKRKRRPSIPPATEEEMAAMGDSLGQGGYATRNRGTRRPVVGEAGQGGGA